MSCGVCGQGHSVKMKATRLIDIFLLFLLTCPSWGSHVVGEKIIITKPTDNEHILTDPTTKETSSGFHQVHHHHHQHHHSRAQAVFLPTISTNAPSYLQDQPPWTLRTRNGGDEIDEDSGNYGYGNNNINTEDNFNLGLMSEMTLISGRNDTLESSYSESNNRGANGTEMYEMDEDVPTFEANIPWWRKMIWSILFGAMVVVACTGNVTVIWIVLAHKRMRTVTNYLLVNLSIADAMSSTLNVIPNYSYMLTGHWPFGALYCRIVQFVSMLSICASVFSLMAIAFDRYMAIMNPLRPRMGKRLTLGIAAGIWIGGVILSMPMLIFFQTFQQENSTTVVCYSEWPDGPQTESHQEYLYNVFFMIFTYFLPIAVMGYTYTRVGIELWGSKSIGECTQRQLDNIKSKRRVVKMMIVVVTIFAFCWLPFHMYFIWVSLWPVITTYSFVQEVYLGIYWLAMSNSMYNPIIYCWMNNRFRRGFQKVFRWCPFVHYTEVETPTMYMMHTQRERETTRYSVTGSPELQVTRVSRNGSGSVHIHLHVMGNEPGRSPSNKSMNMSSSSIQGTSGNQGHNYHGSGHSNHYNGNNSKHNQSTSSNTCHQHRSQCHHSQTNFSSSNSRGNTMV